MKTAAQPFLLFVMGVEIGNYIAENAEKWRKRTTFYG
jgi:hypothetical protein